MRMPLTEIVAGSVHGTGGTLSIVAFTEVFANTSSASARSATWCSISRWAPFWALEATVTIEVRLPPIPPLAEARSEFERDYLTQLLQITNGNVSQAARIAKRNRTEFYKLLHKHHLSPPQFKIVRP